MTFADFVYTCFVVAQNFCQSIIYWNIVKFYFQNDIPITVVLTGSMEPGFQRGDIMGVQSWYNNQRITTGDIVVYQQSLRPVPIVHRLLDKRTIIWPPNSSYNSSGKYKSDDQPPRKQTIYITKGDANAEHDWFLYDFGRRFMFNENLMGTLLGNAPGIGFMTIAFKESRLFQVFFYSLVVLSGFIGYPEG